jgi:DNA-binding PadR family transcriptional regulator
MKGKTRNDEDKLEHVDFISFKPEIVKFIGIKEKKLVDNHKRIIFALKNKNMTVNEIYGLYREPTSGKKAIKTKKTVYRYLDKLEKAGLLVVAGHRKKEGSHFVEKIYARTAKVYFAMADDVPKWWDTEYGKKFAENVTIIVSELLHLSEYDKSAFYSFFTELYDKRKQAEDELFKITEINAHLSDLFSNIDLDEIRHITYFASLITVLVRYPELYNKLQELFK